jgi:hypothetical protein
MIRCLAFDGFSCAFESLEPGSLCQDADYVFTRNPMEDRTQVDCWNQLLRTSPSQCIQVIRQEHREIEVTVAGKDQVILLTDSTGLGSLFTRSVAYIDITGLAHSVWAPLVRSARSKLQSLFVIYMEPDVYKAQVAPSPSSLFDLTESFNGIDPLPGFANLTGPPRRAEVIFVPFLGFEGARARHIVSTMFDSTPPTVPIVGLPGFQIDYPQITLASHQDFLEETNSYSRIRFAKANCPFDAYSRLAEIRRDNPGSYLYLAPIGTKPHALGAVLYAIDYPGDTELLYDHPVRRSGRTKGVGPAHIYCLQPRDAYC